MRVPPLESEPRPRSWFVEQQLFSVTERTHRYMMLEKLKNLLLYQEHWKRYPSKNVVVNGRGHFAIFDFRAGC